MEYGEGELTISMYCGLSVTMSSGNDITNMM